MIQLRVLRFVAPYAILAAASLFTSPLAHAVILFSTGDPTYNTTEPGGTLVGSGWQYEGSFGSFLGTAISPHHFVTVKHIGIQSNVFLYQGVSYPIVSWSDDPISELRIFEVSGTLPSYAPLYSRNNELGRHIVVIGRGTQRGAPVYLAGSLHGWLWGPGDSVQRWGENQISEASGNELWATFDQNGGPNEAQLSAGDSGGAVFIFEHGAWKLAGICFGADGPVWTTPTGGEISAALFDQRGFYNVGDGSPISGTAPVPGRFVAVRISAELTWIQRVIPAPSPTPTPPSARLAQMLSPAAGATLPSSSVAFNWSAGKASTYKVFVGNSLGAADIYDSGTLSVHSIIVNNIPTNGATIYVRLFSKVNRKWKYIDYTYKAYG
jgi:hypothetical protein